MTITLSFHSHKNINRVYSVPHYDDDDNDDDDECYSPTSTHLLVKLYSSSVMVTIISSKTKSNNIHDHKRLTGV